MKYLVMFVILFVIDILLIVIRLRKYKAAMDRHVEEMAQEREQIFGIVAQHSKRILYEYDLKTRTTRPWDTSNKKLDILAHVYTGTYSDQALETNEYVMQDSKEDVKKFFASIHGGVPAGELNVHIQLVDGQLRWYHLKYSGIFENDQFTTVLISAEDITQRHEHEMSHLRHIQTLEDDKEARLIYVECDLTEDRVESLAGQMLSEEEKAVQCAYSDLRKTLLHLKFRYEDFVGSSQYFSCEHFMELYVKGERKLKSQWKVRFNDYKLHWLSTEVILMEDPYNHHVKASISMWDVTKDYEEQRAILHRANYDAMTGILRKDVGEAQIKKHMESGDEKGGILVALDLDDLKGINDTLGHKQGDAAIIRIAETLKGHFRKDDVLIRAGGDEFIVYLTKAGQSAGAVEVSMASLLKKLSEVHIGEHGEHAIHCSAGCAVEVPGTDTYDTLFQRADKALYHVKRNGKSNFAFYVPEMEREDYEFKATKLLSMQGLKKFELAEIQKFLDSIIHFYQLILSVNLSTNVYYIMDEVKDGVFARVPPYDKLDTFVNLASKSVQPDDVEEYFQQVSREALLKAYESGEEYRRHYFRFLYQGQYRWIECVVIFYQNDKQEACDFTMLRWADEYQPKSDRSEG